MKEDNSDNGTAHLKGYTHRLAVQLTLSGAQRPFLQHVAAKSDNMLLLSLTMWRQRPLF